MSGTGMPDPAPPPPIVNRAARNAAFDDSDLEPSSARRPPTNVPKQQKGMPPAGPVASRSSICSSDGFSSSFDSLPLPGQLQRTPVMDFNNGGQAQPGMAQHHLLQQPRVPEDPGQPSGGGSVAISAGTPPRGWDTFRLLPPKPDRRGRGTLYSSCLQLFKLSTFVALFLLTLGTSVLAKAAFLLMAAGLGQAGHNVTICPDKIPESPHNRVFIPPRNAAKWAWALLLALCLPEWLCFARSLHRSLFRRVRAPSFFQFLLVFLVESGHAFGLGALAFAVMPHVPALTMLQFGNALCLVPSLLTALSRAPSRWLPLLLLLDGSAILAQSSALWAGPLAMDRLGFAFLCAALISAAWWQNFVHPHSFLGAVRLLSLFASRLRECRSKTYVVVAPWKSLVFVLCMFHFVPPHVPLRDLLQRDLFGERLITINAESLNQTQLLAFQDRMQDLQQMSYQMSKSPAKKKHRVVEEVGDGEALLNGTGTNKSFKYDKKTKGKPKKEQQQLMVMMKRSRRSTKRKGRFESEEEEETIAAYNIYDDRVELNQFTTPYDAIWMALFQAGCALLCQLSAKFACKVVMQRAGVAFPTLLSVPLGVFLLAHSCRRRATNSCYLSDWISKELFWQCPTRPFLWQHLWTDPQNLLWIGWWLAQLWITIHLWLPRQERLAKSEKLFVLGYFDGPFPEQSLAMDRRRDDKIRIRSESIETDDEDDGSSSTRTYESAISDGGGISPGKAPSICSSLTSSRAEAGLIREQPSAADSICKIYVCATMWHESALEMICMLKSIFRMDEDQSARRNAQRYLKVVDPDYYEFEAHIFFDDAFELDARGNPHPNRFVHQLLEKMDEAASSVHQTQLQLRTPKLFVTPYGGRISYVLPGRNRLTVHLKNKSLIRQRKRWSQVMYLYYLLGYRLMLRVHDHKRRDLLAENTFILTLDGDVDFQPECVHLLVDLMRKNRKLGAACGRIHPRGSGLMVWYQKFEYAVGHWLQKATEHMIGCVLCSPGCFSLFRSAALIDDNVARKYATKSEKPVHYVQYDQGEDRWLCTLLLQRGYRVEYCAASDALTFAPEGFTEFFKQRQRWIPSTMANIIDLLRDYRNVVKVNESVSIWYIAYQLVMLFSSVLGPGTIFLMIVGAISISFNIDTRWALLIMTTPVLCFCICCLTCSTEKQLLMAQVIGALFAMLMTAVIVGTSLQIQKDGILSPHSIFLFTVLGSWFIAAVLHPLEFSCLLPFALYFLAIPCMYMLLPIYSMCNLNTVSWGTRENAQSSSRRKGDEAHLYEQEDGELSLGCGNFCRVVCCVRGPKPVAQVRRLDEMERKLQSLERKTKGNDQQQQIATRESARAADKGQPTAEAERLIDWTAWTGKEPFNRFERVFMDPDEESFWRELIHKYLTPVHLDLQEQDGVQKGLHELRNKCCSGFFMVNIVFIIIVLVLQMQKDCLHIEWPLGPLVNQTRVQCGVELADEEWVMSRLQLEPMGFVFIVFFLVILLIQFLAMLFHRFGTMAHIISSTELCCSRRPVDKLTEEELMAQNAVEIARELQAIRGLETLSDAEQQPAPTMAGQHLPFPAVGGQASAGPVAMASASLADPICPRPPPKMRGSAHGKQQLMKAGGGGGQRTDTLDAAFRKRFFALSSAVAEQPTAAGGLSIGTGSSAGGNNKSMTLNRRTLKALEQRRESIYGGRKRLSAPPDQIQYAPNGSSDSDSENLEALKGSRPQRQQLRAEGPARCHRLEELFRKSRKEKMRKRASAVDADDGSNGTKNSWF